MNENDLTEAAAVVSGAKPWWQSKTIIGAGITAISVVGGLTVGFQLDPETQRLVIDQTYAFVAAGVALGGTVLTIYGRVKAARTVTLTKKGAE